MPRLTLEFSAELRYKEITHHDGGHGWTKSGGQCRNLYRQEKRRMAKVARRNGKVIVAEAADAALDYSLQDWLVFVSAWAEVVVAMHDYKLFLEFMRPMCSGPGYCHICDGEG